ncbi:MAG: hypothetical protein Q8P48_08230 [Deltaproteobacteria bacterium]|nr:hypothetical protein [Deltaproteobacteria bacterium]
MRLGTLLAGILATAVLSGSALAVEENSLRLRLLESSSADSIYTMDERSTLVTSTVPGALAGELEGFCTKNGEVMKAQGAQPKKLSVRCGRIFEAESLEGKQVNNKPVFIIRHTTYEPFAFKNPAYPAFRELAPPRTGRLPGYYSSLDLYQYVYALCKKDGGAPSTVVTKRDGKTVRLAEVSDGEAFDYIFNYGDGKDAWYMECSGSRKFLVEKNYRYEPDEDNHYFFHANRGLDGISYVRLKLDKVARIESGYGIRLDDAERAEFAEFLNMSGLEAFSGKFEGRKLD